MRLAIIAGLLILAGCDSPAPALRGATTQRVKVGGSLFSVHVLGDEAQAIRLNFETGRRARGVMARGFTAIERASGCRIVPGSFGGDPALMRARVTCAEG
ncbi:hypothetical protein [Actibacterium sp. MT2.3-13A]|uniref:hypothetical protein n=1 Tax=Actibacterium sp. MT2.3-13A TaxID=2828332 RepID=UPI001BAADC54|nr:hypothetical protein [Actibacterium sp. MT2.3-13A]